MSQILSSAAGGLLIGCDDGSRLTRREYALGALSGCWTRAWPRQGDRPAQAVGITAAQAIALAPNCAAQIIAHTQALADHYRQRLAHTQAADRDSREALQDSLSALEAELAQAQQAASASATANRALGSA